MAVKEVFKDDVELLVDAFQCGTVCYTVCYDSRLWFKVRSLVYYIKYKILTWKS